MSAELMIVLIWCKAEHVREKKKKKKKGITLIILSVFINNNDNIRYVSSSFYVSLSLLRDDLCLLESHQTNRMTTEERKEEKNTHTHTCVYIYIRTVVLYEFISRSLHWLIMTTIEQFRECFVSEKGYESLKKLMKNGNELSNDIAEIWQER